MYNEVKSVGDWRQSWIGESVDVVRDWGMWVIKLEWLWFEDNVQ